MAFGMRIGICVRIRMGMLFGMRIGICIRIRIGMLFGMRIGVPHPCLPVLRILHWHVVWRSHWHLHVQWHAPLQWHVLLHVFGCWRVHWYSQGR